MSEDAKPRYAAYMIDIEIGCSSHTECEKICSVFTLTVCPRSLDPIYVVTSNIKWVKTSWTAVYPL